MMQPDPLATIRNGLQAADLEIVDTMERVKAVYFETPTHKNVEAQLRIVLQQLLERRDPKLPAGPANVTEARGFVLSGQARAGKSRTLGEVFRTHPSLPGYGDPEANCPLVTVIPQGACTLGRFGQDVFEQLGLPIVNIPTGKNYELKLAHMIRKRLKIRGVKILHVDEAHHVTEPANRKEIKKIVNMFKYLLIHLDWPVSVILSGIPALVAAIRRDTQLSGRMSFMPATGLFPRKDGHRIQHVVGELASVAGLTIEASDLAAVAPRLIHAGDRQLGRSIEITYDAIRLALEGGEATLTLRTFARAYLRSRGVAPDHNPFLARDWRLTDPLLVLDETRKQPLLRARKISRAKTIEDADLDEEAFA
ncbi:TniB family NTP-binding protein [uncultured Methylobacterium sp.]|uniref:TniB family NTP-binding protein n=1 Tax=uncultured Methylobacterium sp. TaxID=157278 RepID=UPI00259752A8|nr:TniB family NTP-binding protein [uncultured Methylobacterium sp.]